MNFALTELLKVAVQDPGGNVAGRVREVAFCPQDDATRVSALIVRTRNGDRLLGLREIESINGGVKARTKASDARWCGSTTLISTKSRRKGILPCAWRRWTWEHGVRYAGC